MREDLRSHSRLWIRKSTNLSCTDSSQLSHDNKCHQWSEEGLWYQWNSLSNINTCVRNMEMMTWFKKKCVCVGTVGKIGNEEVNSQVKKRKRPVVDTVSIPSSRLCTPLAACGSQLPLLWRISLG